MFTLYATTALNTCRAVAQSELVFDLGGFAVLAIENRTGEERKADVPKDHFCTTPHAIRPPALPAGSVTLSSAFSWMTKAVPFG